MLDAGGRRHVGQHHLGERREEAHPRVEDDGRLLVGGAHVRREPAVGHPGEAAVERARVSRRELGADEVRRLQQQQQLVEVEAAALRAHLRHRRQRPRRVGSEQPAALRRREQLHLRARPWPRRLRLCLRLHEPRRLGQRGEGVVPVRVDRRERGDVAEAEADERRVVRRGRRLLERRLEVL